MITGSVEEDTAFDTEIIISINAALMTLSQLGVGPTTPIRVRDSTTTWSEVLLDETKFEMAKEYVYLRTRLVVDPPTGTVLASMKEMLKEDEWRLNVQSEINPSQNQPTETIDYNSLINIPTLNGMELKGDITLDLNDWESSVVNNSNDTKG